MVYTKKIIILIIYSRSCRNVIFFPWKAQKSSPK